MIKRHYSKGVSLVEKHRFSLLLAATILVLIIPAFFAVGKLGEILFVSSMSFLFIQSMIVATEKYSKRVWLRYFIVFLMISMFVLEPVGYKSALLDVARLTLLCTFFIFVTFYLVKFLRKSKKVDINLIITAINIYLLIGIIAGGLAFLCYLVLPGSYNMPSNITNPSFVHFNYYSFITMTTVGYGDITPRIPETQTLAYMIAITGQFYVAIIMAFLVGKLLMHPVKNKDIRD